MRELSLDFRAAINAQETGAVPIFLVTIDHDALSEPIRVSTDPTTRVSDVPLIYKTVSRGEDYIYVPMTVILPDEREGSAPRSTLRIANITPEVVALVRSVTTPPRAKIELVCATPVMDGGGAITGWDGLDDVEVESPWMDVSQAGNQAGQLALELTLNAMTTELAPADSFDPTRFPGLF